MSHRERVLKALRGEAANRIARGEFFIADEFVSTFLALDVGTVVAHEHRINLIERLDADIAAVAFSEGWGAPRNWTKIGQSIRSRVDAPIRIDLFLQ